MLIRVQSLSTGAMAPHDTMAPWRRVGERREHAAPVVDGLVGTRRAVVPRRSARCSPAPSDDGCLGDCPQTVELATSVHALDPTGMVGEILEPGPGWAAMSAALRVDVLSP
jgi:hypothetical protein